jgi:hypothetical protein
VNGRTDHVARCWWITGAAPPRAAIGQVVTDATEQITRLMRDGMRLSAVELSRRVSSSAWVLACSVPLVCWPSRRVQRWALP